MLITDSRSRIRIDIADTNIDAQLVSDDDIDRAVVRAVSDLSRFLPLDAVLEITLDFDVDDEAWTSAAAAGTYVSLASKPIEAKSEEVKNDAGVACARDTDYHIDYTNGKITHISGGKIGNGKGCTISYTKSKVMVDISSILSGMVRVERAEYPVGRVPQEFVSFEPFGNGMLSIGGGVSEPQTQMTNGEHIAIHYKKNHTPPTTEAEGTYPSFLDDTVLLAASAYVLFGAAFGLDLGAKAYIEAAVTLLGTISTSAATTALNAIATELSSGETPLGQVSTEAIAAKAYLTSGSAYINSINKGADVPERYARYAEALGGGYYGIVRAYIEAAVARVTRANSRRDESESRITLQQLIRGEAESYLSSAARKMEIAEKFRREGIEKRNEAWSIWRDPKQYTGDFSLTMPRQPGTYSD